MSDIIISLSKGRGKERFPTVIVYRNPFLDALDSWCATGNFYRAFYRAGGHEGVSLEHVPEEFTAAWEHLFYVFAGLAVLNDVDSPALRTLMRLPENSDFQKAYSSLTNVMRRVDKAGTSGSV